MEFRRLTGVAPFRVEQALGDVKEQRGGAHVTKVCNREVHTFTNDSFRAKRMSSGLASLFAFAR
jgi:hypothetical protein